MAINRKVFLGRVLSTLKPPTVLAIILGGTGCALLLTWFIQQSSVRSLRRDLRQAQMQVPEKLALETDVLALESKTYTTLLHTLVIIALGSLTYVLWQYLRASAQQRAAEQVSLSIHQLGHDKTEVRQGGVYTLFQVARDHPTQQAMIIDIVSAFVRERSRLNPTLPNDVQMALKSLTAETNLSNVALDLTGANLPGAKLSGVHLPGVNLEEANLQAAKLQNANLSAAHCVDANLQGAKLDHSNLAAAQLQRTVLEAAHLTKANLENSDLQLANLKHANLQDANLRAVRLLGADLKGANLQGANLERASLLGTDLEGANLAGANLQGANLLGANLENCDLQGANLTKTKLQGANLQSVQLQGANLQEAELQGINLKGAKYDQNTQFPESFRLPKRALPAKV